MFMENVDGDHFFLSLIANSSIQSEFSFLSVDRSGYFQFYRIPFKKRGKFILPSQWLSTVGKSE